MGKNGYFFGYFGSLIALGVLALLFGLPNASIVLGMVTLGLGFLPIFAAINLLILLVCLLPLVIFWAYPRKFVRVIAFGVSLILMALAATVPHVRSQMAAEASANVIAQTDVPLTRSVKARTVELLRPRQSYYRGADSLGSDLCNDLCRSMLLGNEVDWVRVVTEWDDKAVSQTALAGTSFVGGQGKECALPNRRVSETKRCVLVSNHNTDTASLRIVLQDSEANTATGLKAPSDIKFAGGQRIQLFDRRNSAWELAFQTSEQRMTVARWFAPLVPDMQGMSSDGYAFLTETETFRPIDFKQLAEAAGYSLASRASERKQVVRTDSEGKPLKAWQQLPSEDLTRQIISLLDTKSTAVFDQDKTQLISKWARYARNYDSGWEQWQIDIVHRLLLDPRLKSAVSMDHIFRDKPVRTALLPVLLRELKARPLPKYEHSAIHSAMYSLRYAPASDLKSHREDLRDAAINLNKGGYTSIPVHLLARIGEDVFDLIPPAEASWDLDSHYSALKALCFMSGPMTKRADAVLKKQWLYQVDKNPRKDRAGTWMPDFYEILALRGLTDFAEPYVKGLDEKAAERLRRQGERAVRNGKERECRT